MKSMDALSSRFHVFRRLCSVDSVGVTVQPDNDPPILTGLGQPRLSLCFWHTLSLLLGASVHYSLKRKGIKFIFAGSIISENFMTLCGNL